VAAGLAALVLLHYRFLEVAARGLGGDDPVALLVAGLRHLPRFYAGFLGGDQVAGWPALALAMAVLVALPLLRAPRPVWFLVGMTLLAPLPFAAMGYSERYGYFASAPAALVIGWSLGEGWGRLAGGRVGVRLGGVILALLLGATLWQSGQRCAEERAVSRETGGYAARLAELRPTLGDLHDVMFLNLPPMLKWNINDLWGVDRAEDLIVPHDQAVFCTATHYFGPPDFGPLGYRHVVEADRGDLLLHPPDRPLGARTAIPDPCFLAGDLEVLPVPDDLGPGVRGELRRLRLVQDRLAETGDPRERVLVEAPVAGLSPPLPTGELRYVLEPLPDVPEADLAHGARFPVRLRVTTDLPRPGLLVVVTYLTPEEPVHRLGGDVGRFCRHVQATLDGAPAPVIPVYFHLTGVVVPAGHHEVVVQQRPPPREDR